MKTSTSIRIFAFILALVTLSSLLSACGGDGETTSAPEISDSPTLEESVETTSPTAPTHLDVVKDGASEYVIIRPEKDDEVEISAMKSLRDLIKNAFSVTLQFDTDGKRPNGTDPEYKILIGKTNDPASAPAVAFVDSLKPGESAFSIRVTGNHIAIAASSATAYSSAMDYIKENFITESGMRVPVDLVYDSEVTTLNPSAGISETGELSVTMNELYSISTHTDKNGVKCRIIQGSCTDGEYLYTCLNDGASSGAVTTIVKTELRTGKVIAKYESLMIDHANDLTYNPKTNEIVAVHNSPNRTHVSFFDADTLELKELKKIRLQIYSIEYDEYEDCYWVGISHGYNYAKFDAKLERQITFVGFNNGFTKQGMDADDKYVYFVLYNTNCIAVYTKDGKYVRQIDLPITAGEPENISHVGDVFYIVYNNSSWTGGIVYETIIKEK